MNGSVRTAGVSLGLASLVAACVGVSAGAPAAAADLTRTEVVCTAQAEENYSPAITSSVHDSAITGTIKLLSCTESLIDTVTGGTLSTTSITGTFADPVAIGTFDNVVLADGTCTSLPVSPPTISGQVDFTWYDPTGGTGVLQINNPLTSTVNGDIVFAATHDDFTATSTRYPGYDIVAAGLGDPVHQGSCAPGQSGVTKVTGAIQFTFTSP
ncbi:hypothetical protein TR51_00090 [Kitasatospora griseola]|uniref:Lipoprotein n=1 Tax=Kitasatospora griseola TaxID=2064 RepID=A0A0D0PUE8_KITGR|nr:hypothetical protein [Kitasatospora griseola]KIQ66149.1 hypothetical protein TR51_00090 [Kitasatospora griseola]